MSFKRRRRRGSAPIQQCMPPTDQNNLNLGENLLETNNLFEDDQFDEECDPFDDSDEEYDALDDDSDEECEQQILESNCDEQIFSEIPQPVNGCLPIDFTNFQNNFSQGNNMDTLDNKVNKSNAYMAQAIAEVGNLEKELRINRKQKKKRVIEKPSSGSGVTKVVVEEEKETTNSLGVKVTGWLFKSVVVPPNMYVVHTRRGYKKPLHIGLGMSFRYNPHQDSFLVVPSSMQTIIISANTICKELQGILIQAYVQWIIDDIEIAYQRLDFSDAEDPMRVVTLQLREQAEAAIKDKVATMSINEVLSDKQPIIKELTKRLKEVAEGFGDDRGLGIKIITVQIKEAIVSSANLWENLQKPFRSSQMATARLAEIENQSTVNKRELEEQQQQQDAQQVIREKQLELNHRVKTIEQSKGYEQRQQNIQLELDSFALQEQKIKAEKQIQQLEIESNAELQEQRKRLEAKLSLLSLDSELECQKKRDDAQNEQSRIEIEFEEKRQKIANALSQEQIQAQAIAMMPEIAKSLPHPNHSVNISGDSNNSSLPAMIASIASVLRSYGIRFGETEEE